MLEGTVKGQSLHRTIQSGTVNILQADTTGNKPAFRRVQEHFQLHTKDFRIAGVTDEGTETGGIGHQQLQVGIIRKEHGNIQAQLVVPTVKFTADLIAGHEFRIERRCTFLRWKDSLGITS